MALHDEHHHDGDHGIGLDPETIAIEHAARYATAVDRAVTSYQRERAAEAVGYFARQGKPGPSLFTSPTSHPVALADFAAPQSPSVPQHQQELRVAFGAGTTETLKDDGRV